MPKHKHPREHYDNMATLMGEGFWYDHGDHTFNKPIPRACMDAETLEPVGFSDWVEREPFYRGWEYPMPTHKHPRSHYETMATLMGPSWHYDAYDHTLSGWMEDGMIDPDTGARYPYGENHSSRRQSEYVGWTYPDEPSTS